MRISAIARQSADSVFLRKICREVERYQWDSAKSKSEAKEIARRIIVMVYEERSAYFQPTPPKTGGAR